MTQNAARAATATETKVLGLSMARPPIPADTAAAIDTPKIEASRRLRARRMALLSISLVLNMVPVTGDRNTLD
jgi:hypothetical protein